LLLLQPQLVAAHGYPSESHVVRTEDGYLLTLHRIPGGRLHQGPSGGASGRPVVFLQHGLLASSADWVLTGPGKSLGKYCLQFKTQRTKASNALKINKEKRRGTF